MKWWPSSPITCGCDADVTKTTAVIAAKRGRPKVLKRARMVWHYRERDEARFWHWSDLDVVKI